MNWSLNQIQLSQRHLQTQQRLWQLTDTEVLQWLSGYTSTPVQTHNCCLSLSEESVEKQGEKHLYFHIPFWGLFHVCSYRNITAVDTTYTSSYYVRTQVLEPINIKWDHFYPSGWNSFFYNHKIQYKIIMVILTCIFPFEQWSSSSKQWDAWVMSCSFSGVGNDSDEMSTRNLRRLWASEHILLSILEIYIKALNVLVWMTSDRSKRVE